MRFDAYLVPTFDPVSSGDAPWVLAQIRAYLKDHPRWTVVMRRNRQTHIAERAHSFVFRNENSTLVWELRAPADGGTSIQQTLMAEDTADVLAVLNQIGTTLEAST